MYRAEKILRERKCKGVVEYFVKWKDYPDKLNSWVAESDILKSSELSKGNKRMTSHKVVLLWLLLN